jgi:large subunit ribosomal protein L10
MNKEVLQAKKETVSEIEKSLDESSAIAVVSYQGLTVAELIELRRALAEKNAHMGVYKNTLVARAFKEKNLASIDEYLQGPNAFVFSKEANVGPAVINKFSRYHEKLVIKGGLVEGRVVDADGIVAIAKLPDKKGMLSMLCMVLNEPVASFARAVKSVADKSQPAEAKAPAAAAPAAAAN